MERRGDEDRGAQDPGAQDRGAQDRGADRDRVSARDADEVDRLIDELIVRADDGDGDDEVVAALQRLRTSLVEPLPPASRNRHLATIRTAPDGPESAAPAAPGWGARLQRRLAPITAVATALVLFAGGGTVALAQDAGPDDALYGVKLASEQAWVALPRGSERAAEVHLALAERRIGEARGAPHHAEGLVAAGVENIEAAAEEKPEEAIETFARLLGSGDEALPANASDRARWALARNCHRIAAKHGLEHLARDCPDLEDLGGEFPGRGAGPADGPRGWGPGGRPDGHVGPPAGVPAHDRGTPGVDDDG